MEGNIPLHKGQLGGHAWRGQAEEELDLKRVCDPCKGESVRAEERSSGSQWDSWCALQTTEVLQESLED